jgi:hypothetical protein
MIRKGRVRWLAKVGTTVRTFDVVNKGNVPCGRNPPCSPDGKWKATVGSVSLDTGEQGKQFRNARVSCIAGPCPFSTIELDRFSLGGRMITASVRNWSDPVTYLIEAEVIQTMESELIRHTYPVTFGRTMNFTLPAIATGPSIEADVNGSQIVFPLGPELRLSWASCRFESPSDGTIPSVKRSSSPNCSVSQRNAGSSAIHSARPTAGLLQLRNETHHRSHTDRIAGCWNESVQCWAHITNLTTRFSSAFEVRSQWSVRECAVKPEGEAWDLLRTASGSAWRRAVPRCWPAPDERCRSR